MTGETMATDNQRTRKAGVKDLFKSAGVSGLTRFGTGGPGGGNGASGMIFEEWDPDLRADRGRRVYREMRDEDPVIGAFLFAIEMMIRQVPWHMQAADDSDEAAEVAEFVNSCLHDMEVSWPDTISEALSMLQYGWDVAEILYKHRSGPHTADPIHHSKHDDGRVGWRAFATRGQETLFRWDYDEDDNLVAMAQLGPPDYVLHTVPLAKALLFRTSTYKGNPEGRSILRNAFRSYKAKKHIQAIEGIGVERDLAGLPVAYVPPAVLLGATDDDAEALTLIKQLVTNIRRDEQEGVVFPLAYNDSGNPTYKLELLSTGGTRQFDTTKIVERYDARIAMTVLADFILLGHEQTGTYALGASKLGAFALAISAWLDSLAGPWNDKAIPDLVALNGWDTKLSPRLAHHDIEKADLGAMGTYLKNLSDAGILPHDAGIIKHLLEIAELPVPEEEVLNQYADPHDDKRLMTAQVSQVRQQEADAQAPKQPAPAGSRSVAKATSEVYNYGSTQLDLPSLKEQIGRFARTIAREDLAGKGIEQEPHITVQYGLVHADEGDQAMLRHICDGFAPMYLGFGPGAFFPASDAGSGFDVLYLPVDSDDLYRLRNAIGQSIDVVNTHDGYTPHVTIAYLKPGTAQKYEGRIVLDTWPGAPVFDLTLSDRHGVKTRIPFLVRSHAMQAAEPEHAEGYDVEEYQRDLQRHKRNRRLALAAGALVLALRRQKGGAALDVSVLGINEVANLLARYVAGNAPPVDRPGFVESSLAEQAARALTSAIQAEATKAIADLGGHLTGDALASALDSRLLTIVSAEIQRATAGLFQFIAAGTPGLYVVRSALGTACDTCADLAGEYHAPYPEELWWTHPHCQCSWHILSEPT
ncbi:MAG: hypothetical protein JWO59_725 [Chloroflexi bacterium]|nr:hypothetical protein [Chloroflexota bacterium]